MVQLKGCQKITAQPLV